MLKKIIFILLLSCIVGSSDAQQSKEDLQRKQQDLISEIEVLNRTLREIRKSKKQSIGQLELYKQKIRAREELIQNINKDIRSLDDNIYLSSLQINKLRKELDTLKAEYAKSLVFAYKNRSNYDYLNFIFSAATFNDAIKRITYLKSYRQYREQQVNNILETQQLIEDKIAQLNDNKKQKSVALQDQGKQLKVLEVDKKEQDQAVAELKTKESSLASEIKTREKQRQKMREAIASIIRREQKEAMERARVAKLREAEKLKKEKEARAAAAAAANNTAANNGNNAAPKAAEPEPVKEGVAKRTGGERTYSAFESTEEGKAQSLSFEGGRGRLPWPVDAGYVSIPFGNYKIPGTTLTGQSDGYTITLPVGSSVKSVSDGDVSSVFDLGGEQAVIVRHGKYFTTYSHLSSVNVSRGQQVRAGTVVGRAAANDDGEGEVLFMVTNEKGQSLNPQAWLKKR
ncbi:hypothetical protein EXU57_10720 [Segetibacter sp. 3557_3]|uniref:murein hydrolase activator EnvC family protein n=1 Tax=Segetibacter sp. 3557_3 TaxID=2547429 RepID=UPI00105880A9|nr:peptidoglycan DD-metalloendopeptidase family protein [Segetibacter sp. 3557_3]TDH26555.1 hypothetical protein EXU57_10720 [Segetibacter sp. 3557_3]